MNLIHTNNLHKSEPQVHLDTFLELKYRGIYTISNLSRLLGMFKKLNVIDLATDDGKKFSVLEREVVVVEKLMKINHCGYKRNLRLPIKEDKILTRKA
ncbi:CLUMA_CG005103, isoform A [Clunio marinus]|uniref:CLUMA_CG005103, isoform A n=1 Tax=Clunio marinus TaxID=568069 RepID=A0A1J1HTN9_9DIPT|nr:CLUMA_CG005103, isoform A [Clunio marinus]